MIIVADENIGPEIVRGLRDNGHSVSWISEGFRGSDDPIVRAKALKSHALLITQDKDFGELVFSQNLPSSGVLLLRIHDMTYRERTVQVLETIRREGASLLGRFSVLTAAGLRSREI